MIPRVDAVANGEQINGMSVSSARNPTITEGKAGIRPATQRVLVIVPAYNEALNLPALISKLRTSHPSFDVLVVDDGSTDQTKMIVSKLPVRLISLSCNLGVGGAMQTGLRVALQDNYDVAIQVDGDGQHPPEQISKLLAAMQQNGNDMVLGSRFLSVDGYQSTLGRRVGIRFFSRILSALCHMQIADPTSGFRARNRRAIRVLPNEYPEDYPEVEAILMLHRANLRIAEVPVQMMERVAGRSSIGIAQAITYMIKVPLAILMNLLRKREPQSSQ